MFSSDFCENTMCKYCCLFNYCHVDSEKSKEDWKDLLNEFEEGLYNLKVNLDLYEE